MNKYRFIVCSLFVLSQFSLPAVAKNWSLGGYVESVAINPDIAQREGVEDSAYGVTVEAGYALSEWFDVDAGLSLLMYDDNESFSQTVQSYFGGISHEDSEASGLLYYVEAGPRWSPADSGLVLSAKLGIAGLDSDRSIPNCSDCYEENIDIEAGSYAQLSMAYRFESWELVMKYNSYFGDEGLDNMVRVGARFY